MKNLLAAQNLELRHVVKTTVFMTDLTEFDKTPYICRIYLKIF